MIINCGVKFEILVVSPEGDTTKEIPVVQAKCYTKYLGHLTLNFDAEGELKKPMKEFRDVL